MDCEVEAIAANLVSIRSSSIHTLQLTNLCTFRCLTACPLQDFRIDRGNVHAAELLYLVEHTNLHRLTSYPVIQLPNYPQEHEHGIVLLQEE